MCWGVGKVREDVGKCVGEMWESVGGVEKYVEVW